LLGEHVGKVNIFIGPEGGLGDQEVEYALSCGILIVSLGQRILRAETAAIASIVAVMYDSGELGC
jgi:16S rRNA (uracil1498-N3)-methyltransferase